MRKLYPWDKWLGKPRTRLRKGVDYSCPQSSICQQIRNAATRLGVRVTVDETKDGKGVVIEVVEREDKA
jgi:hypothetical protein